MKRSQPKHRLTLFYVANDVVQYAKQKKLEELYEALKNGIADVIPLLRDDAIHNNFQRVLTGWTQREVFDEDFNQDLNNSLDTVMQVDEVEELMIIEVDDKTVPEENSSEPVAEKSPDKTDAADKLEATKPDPETTKEVLKETTSTEFGIKSGSVAPSGTSSVSKGLDVEGMEVPT